MVTASLDLAHVRSMLDIGRLHANDGDLVAAAAVLGQARDALAEALETDDAGGDEPRRLLARAHLGLAFVEAETTGRADDGIAHLDAAAAVLPPDAADLEVALLGQYGILLFRAGRWDDALARFVEAEDALDRTSSSHRASMLLNRGLLRVELGHTEEARADLERSVVEANAAGQPRTAYKARHNMALAAFVEGDLPRAIRGMAGAPEHGDGTRETPDPISMMDRGRVLLEAGLVEEADELLGEAQRSFEHHQRRRDLGEAELFRAEAALVGGELLRAADLAAAAVADFTAGGNDRWRRRAELVALAVDALTVSVDGSRLDHERDVEDLRRRALRLARESDDDVEVATLARLIGVEAALAAHHVDDANREFEDVDLPATSSLRLRLRWHDVRAGLAPPDEVLGVVEQGVAELAAAQEQVGSRDLRTAMALHGRALVQRGIATSLASDDTSQLHRAVDLAHAASTRLTPVRATLGLDERRLVSELRAVENRQWREPDVSEEVRSMVEARATDLRSRLRARSWERRGPTARAPSAVVTAGSWQRALAETGAVGASFFTVGGELHALRTTAGGSTVVGLGPARAVMSIVDRLRADLRVLVLPRLAPAMQAAVHASLAESLAQLDAAVGVQLRARGRELVVVPHGALALVPWCLLPSRRGAATTATASATAWVQRRQRRNRPTTSTTPLPVVVCLAGPGLDRAEDEVAGVAAAWGVTPLDHLAEGDDLRAALASDADVIHVAAHGVHRRESPLFSSVRLADGPLFAHELVERTATRVVVLSACDVGEQSVRPGDEPLGFAAALLELGVDSVVGSVAPIRDDVAAQFGADLHQRLSTGRGLADAVSEVAQDAWARGVVTPLVVLGNGLDGVA